MKQLSDECIKELKKASEHVDGRLSYCIWERRRDALMRRGLVDKNWIITEEGRKLLKQKSNDE